MAYVSPGHWLILVNKGDPLEQSGKLERSGLRQHFKSVEIVAEKDTPAYKTIIQKHNLHPPTTWKVGNSPKSDINPALLAGLQAVFEPHDKTRILEHEELCQPPQTCLLLGL